ncbi:MAG: hypothetical protein ABSC05_19810 [Candidatus Solibacter sp.]|jgi:hypothetical protein
MFNLTVAACEFDLRPQLDAWSLMLPVWHGDVAEHLGPERELLGEAPLPWKAALAYARSVMETVGDVVVARAESADELTYFSDLLDHLEGNFGAHFFHSHLNNWANPEGLQTVFHRFLHAELRTFREKLVRTAWQKYHARLSGELQSGPGHSNASDAKAAIRSSIVSPLLTAKKWTPNRWATAAGVSKNCAYEYLAGTRDLSEENRRAMAEELGLATEQLPNG